MKRRCLSGALLILASACSVHKPKVNGAHAEATDGLYDPKVVLLATRPELEVCMALAPQSDEAYVTAVVAVAIDTEGKTGTVRIYPTTLGGSPFGKCLREMVEGMKFPPRAEATTLAVPFYRARDPKRAAEDSERRLELRRAPTELRADLQQRCESDEYEACYRLGLMHRMGGAGARDDKEAARLFRSACNSGIPDACAALGSIYEDSHDPAQDDSAIVRLYKQACDGDGKLGCYALGVRHLKGRGAPRDEAVAKQLFRRSCNAGSPRSCSLVAVMSEEHPIAGEDVDTPALFQLACVLGDPQACHAAATKYWKAHGVQEDKMYAFMLLNLACEGGDGQSCHLLSTLARDGTPPAKQDQALSTRLSTRACELGHQPSCAKP